MARIPTFDIPQGDTRNATVDISAASSDFGVSATSVVWSVDKGTTVTISGTPTVSSNVSTGTLVADANKTGCSLIKAKFTLSDAQTISKFFIIDVIKPVC